MLRWSPAAYNASKSVVLICRTKENKCLKFPDFKLSDNDLGASLQRLHIAYNDAIRVLLKRPRSCSASKKFVAAGVNTFQTVLRNLMYECIRQLNASENEIILVLSDIRFSTTHYQSQLWRHWYSCLFVKH